MRVLPGETYEKMVLPVLSPDPNTDATCPTWILDPQLFFVLVPGKKLDNSYFLDMIPKWRLCTQEDYT